MSGQGPGQGQQYLRRAPPAPQNVEISELNTDPSLDTIFYATGGGAATYAVARFGLEFSKASSVGMAVVVGAGIYTQFWAVAIRNVRRVSGQWGSLIREEAIKMENV
jgi:hypothetical protein